ncbi:MAG: putative basic amino acid antiporter YfcC [Lysobacteraceae bacterium]
MNTPHTPASREPDTLLVLLGVAALFALLVPFVPAGSFAPGQPPSLASYVPGDAPVALALFSSEDSVRGFLNLFFDGFTSGGRSAAAVGVIAFVLTVGGAFGLVQASGAVDNGLKRLVAATGGQPRLLLSALFVAFSLGGAVFGMGEETIAFLALLLPLVRQLGYPPETGVMVTYMASQIGFGTSWMNPFSVAVAQGVAGVPLLSGAPFRIAMWVVFTAAALAFTLHYAERHRRTPEMATATVAPAPLGWVDHAVLLAVAATVAWIVWGVVAGGYYIPEIATQFFALGLFAGTVAVIGGRTSANGAAAAFTDGVRALVPTALVIALAKGLLGLLGGSDPHAPSVLNTMLYGIGSAIEGTPELVAAWGMLAAQAGFNFFVSSGSAQATITMPLMAGLGQLVGVSKQVSVLCFQLGDGLTNLLIPTSGAMMGAIGVARIAWLDWIRIIGRLVAGLFLMAALAVAIAVGIGYA